MAKLKLATVGYAMLVLAVLGLTMACVGTTGGGGGSENETPTIAAQSTGLAGGGQQSAVPVGSPVRICLQQDKTGSAVPNLVPQITTDDLGPLFDLLRRTGGELAFGILNAASDHPLVRLRVETPPPEPVKPASMATEPEKPAKAGNILEDARLEDGWEKKHEEWQSEFDAWHEEAYDDWRTAREEWQKDTDDRTGRFTTAIAPLLREQPGGYTDVAGAVRRCDLFLAESDATWGGRTSHRWFALVSDGEESAGSEPVTSLESNATTLVVNATAVLGVLEPLNPGRFEAIAAAFQHIIAVEAGR